ncbi:MAG: hypothetical protein KDN18_24325 [Verrucomicrobiae bacterium]|nr:hypothetical protein [Verrucomicrobiae bacterium]
MKASLALIAATFLATSFSPLRAEEDSIKVSEFTFSYGKPWIRQQAASSMRAGQFLYDHADESLTDTEMVIFFFGAGGGGGVQANIQRWLGQFEGTPESKMEEKEMGGKKVVFLTAKGTYMETMAGAGPFSGAPKTPKPDYLMLAAILPSEQGDVFIKVTGPAKSVEAMREAFDAFVASPFKQ